ncbi:hypothetical protein MHU86_6130 [Fragilaria crotonensis]|nr:hypothetical protein MHU86_6130 [Fragilaria crotonensis]
MILYACICRARDAVMLVELKEVGGNSDQVMQALTERLVEIPEALPSGTRKTFSQRNTDTGDFFGDLVAACTGGYVSMDGTEHFFQVWHSSGLFLTCISDDAEFKGQEVNFDFLKELETDFTKEYSSSRIGRAKALSMQKQFLPNIRSKVHYYNINRTKLCREQKVQSMMDKIEDMKTVLDQNIRLMVKRQEGQLDEMLEKSETMKQDTVVFRKKAEVLLLSARRRQFVRTLTCTIISLGAIYLILAAGCGFTFEACHPKNSSS